MDQDKASNSLNVPKQVRQHNAGQDGVKKAGHKATLFSKHFYSSKSTFLRLPLLDPYEADKQLEADCVLFSVACGALIANHPISP